MKYTRQQIQEAYIRVCMDSGFQMEYIEAAKFTAKLLGLHPIEIWIAMGYMDTMEEIAKGIHPALHKYSHGNMAIQRSTNGTSS